METSSDKDLPCVGKMTDPIDEDTHKDLYNTHNPFKKSLLMYGNTTKVGNDAEYYNMITPYKFDNTPFGKIIDMKLNNDGSTTVTKEGPMLTIIF